MKRPDFDKMTDKEERQFRAWINRWLGTKRRKQGQERKIKPELGQESEVQNADCK
jgi:hypothetical protein